MFSSHRVKQCVKWVADQHKELCATSKNVGGRYNVKSTCFPFPLSPLPFHRLPNTAFWLQTKCYRQGLAISLTHPSAAMTHWCPTLPTLESLIFAGVTLGAQGNHRTNSNTIWKRHFPVHTGWFGSMKQAQQNQSPLLNSCHHPKSLSVLSAAVPPTAISVSWNALSNNTSASRTDIKKIKCCFIKPILFKCCFCTYYPP